MVPEEAANAQGIFTDEMEALARMPVLGLVQDQEGSSLPPFLAFGDDDEDEDAEDEEENFDDMEDDFDDDFEDEDDDFEDEDDDFEEGEDDFEDDYDGDYDDDFEE
jgi:hypothetical protein